MKRLIVIIFFGLLAATTVNAQEAPEGLFINWTFEHTPDPQLKPWAVDETFCWTLIYGLLSMVYCV